MCHISGKINDGVVERSPSQSEISSKQLIDRGSIKQRNVTLFNTGFQQECVIFDSKRALDTIFMYILKDHVQ